jgi:hypothetical protein
MPVLQGYSPEFTDAHGDCYGERHFNRFHHEMITSFIIIIYKPESHGIGHSNDFTPITFGIRLADNASPTGTNR